VRDQALSDVRPVVVAMLTYKRPDDLAEAVPAILDQTENDRRPATLLIVDNDPLGSAAEAVGRFADRGVRYVNEVKPGIAAARNRALDEVDPDALLIFIDDDERPCDGWLLGLLDTQARYGSAGVVGPVVSEYDREPAAWITEGRIFDRRRMPTGSEVDVAATNNLLLDMAEVRRLGVRFDEQFGLSGGSDTLFTRQLHQRGGRMIWCDEALVVDRVPVGRLTVSWMVQRAFRFGNSWTRTALVLATSPARRGLVRVDAVARGLVRVGGGALRFGGGALRRDTGRMARGARTAARGAGLIGGVFGYVYHEYRRTGVEVPPVAIAGP
jgi:glycosyltransferase involved in cell wall biosynthesis